MHCLIFVSTVISCILADSYLYPVPLQQLQTPSLEEPRLHNGQQQKIQQYFTHNSLGQYSYGYIEPLSVKQEIRTLDGVTSGSYSYIDANGLLQTVDYSADDEGFHVVATNLPKTKNNVPKPVEETAEVAAAREQHMAAHRAILEGNPSASSILPKPVEDTTEVAEAKKEFFARFSAEQEKHRLLKEIALLRNQKFSKVPVPALKLKSTRGNFISDGYTFGYRINAAIKPRRYYLPIV